MRSGGSHGLLVLLLVHIGLVHSFVPCSFPSGVTNCHEVDPPPRSFASKGAMIPRLPSHGTRPTASTVSHVCRRQSDEDGSRFEPRWLSPAKAVLSSLLATALIFTGSIPGWELSTEQHSGGRGGVPLASAASFNDEQRAIAETWVRMTDSGSTTSASMCLPRKLQSQL